MNTKTDTTVLSVKLDKKIKKEAQELAESLGFPLSTLVSAYLRKIIRTGRVEFEAPTKVTPKLAKFIKESRKEIEAGEIVGPFSTAEEFIADLKK